MIRHPGFFIIGAYAEFRELGIPGKSEEFQAGRDA
jgi:hypothetical protein